MQAMILCGGKGTRLREYTETLPKPMVEIGGKPMLWHVMKTYAHYGVTDFILCLGYKGHVIKEYFLNYEAMTRDFTIELGAPGTTTYHPRSSDGAIERWRVTLADTGEETMTGARILCASRYLDPRESTFAVTYGDGVANVDLGAVLAFHKGHGRIATVTGVRPTSRFGELTADGEKVLSFSEKPQVAQGLINGGFFLFERDFLRYLSDDPACTLERAPLERCASDGELYVYQHTGYWQCMDTFRDWEALDQKWRRGQAPWKVWA